MANDNKKTTFSGFAKYLFDNKLLNEDDIISSLAVKSSSFIDVIYHKKYMLGYEIAWAIAKYNKYTYIDLAHYSERLISLELDMNWIKRSRIVPLKIKKDTIFVVLDNPVSLNNSLNDLREKYRVKNVVTFVADRLKLNRFIENLTMLNQTSQPTASPEKEVYVAMPVVESPALVVPQPEKKVVPPVIEKSKSDATTPEEPEKRSDVVSNKRKKSETVEHQVRSVKPEAIAAQTQLSPQSDKNDSDIILTKYIQKVLISAVNSEVSEIHFEPYEKKYRIRFKQYGELYESFVPPAEIKNDLSKKLKTISNMDVADLKPQHGKFSLKISEIQNIDFKVISCPTAYGEKIVVKVMEDSAQRLSFDNLGYSSSQATLIKSIIKKGAGLCVFSGPANSGKTYSMYNALNELNVKNKNLYTIENVIGFNLVGVNQLKVRPDLSYEDLLFFIEGQSPDAILLDNIDNKSVAKQALSISQRGRLIFTGMNAESVSDTFEKLYNMGFSGYDIASSLKMVCAQRLFPMLCNECKTQDILTKNMLIKKGFSEDTLEGLDITWKIYREEGCASCNQTGHKGFVPVFDILVIDDELKSALIHNTQEQVLNLVKSKCQDLKVISIDKIKKGLLGLNVLTQL